ncbi:MAG: hypothetical protein ABSD85_10745 [Acidimicrobiales bacterium]|jgi:hypothetical protein
MGVRSRWRKLSWVALIWNLLTVLGVIAVVASVHATTSHCFRGCPAKTTGDVVAMAVIVVAWFVGDFILGILWLVTKANQRQRAVLETT